MIKSKDRMMASELIAELQARIESQGDQPVEISVNSNRQNDKSWEVYDTGYIINNQEFGEYPVQGCNQHFRINVRLENDRKIVRQKVEAA